MANGGEKESGNERRQINKQLAMRRTLHYTPWEFPKDGGGKPETQHINN